MTDQRQPTPSFVHWERNFVQEMQRLREAKKMTQTDLARELQRFGLRFHQQTIQRLEAAERPVRLNEAHLIAEVLGVDLDSMTAAARPEDRDLYHAVSRLRDGSGSFAVALLEQVDQWIEDIEKYSVEVSERLMANPNKPDEVTRWGLAWGLKILWAWQEFDDAWTHLTNISGDVPRWYEDGDIEMELPTPQVIEAIRVWIERYGGPDIDDLALKTGPALQAAFPELGEPDGPS